MSSRDDEIHVSKSVRETESIAAALGHTLFGGECLALHGPLGAGKTQFVRGLVAGLGGDPRVVSSPTFVLLNVYEGGHLTVFHLDAYRIGGGEDFEAIGFAELLEQENAIVVVEWADRVAELLPRNLVRIHIGHLAEGRRQIRISRQSADA